MNEFAWMLIILFSLLATKELVDQGRMKLLIHQLNQNHNTIVKICERLEALTKGLETGSCITVWLKTGDDTKDKVLQGTYTATCHTKL